MSDSDRPAWFTGPDEALAVLRRAAERRGVTLDPAVPPGAEEAGELTEALSDILLSEGGLDGELEMTPFGTMIEDLLDLLGGDAESG
ncbi:hypothetical protein [Kitasatospora camelliae]|uniref:Carrier domain-containing protein n=1 Tax=Kitasatospora camelliae TaxID=3156397 RepID=A0AAU8K5Q4_9ACTN